MSKGKIASLALNGSAIAFALYMLHELGTLQRWSAALGL